MNQYGVRSKDQFGLAYGSKKSEAVKLYNMTGGSTPLFVESVCGRQINVLYEMAEKLHLVTTSFSRTYNPLGTNWPLNDTRMQIFYRAPPTRRYNLANGLTIEQAEAIGARFVVSPSMKPYVILPRFFIARQIKDLSEKHVRLYTTAVIVEEVPKSYPAIMLKINSNHSMLENLNTPKLHNDELSIYRNFYVPLSNIAVPVIMG